MVKELEAWYRLHKFHFYGGEYQTKELANYLSVSPRTIQRWVKEKTEPSKAQLVKIRQFLAQKGQEESL